MDNDHVNGLDRLLSSVKVETVYVPYANEVVLVLALIQAELQGALSASLIEASIDPQSWFTSRGAEPVVRVREAPDDGSSDPDDGGEPGRPDPSRVGPRDDSAAHAPQRPGAPGTPSGIRIMESGDPVPIPGQGQGPHWTLVPHVDPAPPERRGRFETKLRNLLGLSPGQQLSSAPPAAAMRDRSARESLRECYNEIVPRGFGRMHNRVSMSLYSGPAGSGNSRAWSYRVSCWPEFYPAELPELYPHPYLFLEPEAVGWIGTGDATLDVRKVRTAWDRTYRSCRDQVVTLLLPHHGSRHNFHPE